MAANKISPQFAVVSLSRAVGVFCRELREFSRMRKEKFAPIREIRGCFFSTALNGETIQFAICIQSDDPDLLTPRMIYQIMPDASAERSKHVRVIDNEGEDYLYPARFFLFMDFPSEVKRTLKKIPSRAVSISRLPRV